MLNIGSSEENHASKSFDLHDKNVCDSAGYSIGCPNTMSDAKILALESRDPQLAEEYSIEKRDLAVPFALSNIE